VHREIARAQPAHQTGRAQPRSARRPRAAVQILLPGMTHPHRGGSSGSFRPAEVRGPDDADPPGCSRPWSAVDYSGSMTDTAILRLARLIRDTEGCLLPLTGMAGDVVVARVEFGFDLPTTPTQTTAAPHAVPRTAPHSGPPTAPHTGSPAGPPTEAVGHASLTGTVVLVTEPVSSPAG